MQTYNYLANELPRELIEIYNDLQNDVLKIIVKRLKQGASVEVVFQEIRDMVDGYNPKLEDVLMIIFANSKRKTVKDNEKEFKKETEDRQAVSNSQANALIAPALVSGLAILKQLNNKIVNNAVNKYTQENMYANSGYGDKSKRLQQVFSDLANNGIKIRESFGSSTPKNYSIDAMLRRDVMYKVNQANAKVNMENFKKSSAKFIEVSSHPTARTWTKYMKHQYEDHSSWQGQVYYSREGEPVENYEEFESTCGFGKLLGICGINCYHQFQLNFDGVGTQDEYSIKEIRKNYGASQEQKKYENAIRKMKQAKSVYEMAGDENKVNKLKNRISDATSYLKSFCERNNLKYYNWRVMI